MTNATISTPAETTVAAPSLAEQIKQIKASGKQSVWEGVKEHSQFGLNVGIGIGVAVVVVSLVGAACSYIPRANTNQAN